MSVLSSAGRERQLTNTRDGKILANTGVWSPDSRWIVFDTRSDPAGDLFDGDSIQAVDANTGETRELYRSRNGAHCGVPTWHPSEMKVVFILGPEDPDPDWQYNAFHRKGVIVNWNAPGKSSNLDARDITPPFTPGALRGGTHVHVWHPRGDWVRFTYEDHVLAQFDRAMATNDINQRNIGVSVPHRPVKVSKDHKRNHDGDYFSVLVTLTSAEPKPGTDEISRACEEGWVGTNGYVRIDGIRQERAIAFQGQVAGRNGKPMPEVFIVDLPSDVTRAGEGSLCGTEIRRPYPPAGVVQRRLTFTADRKYPGIQGPRHWLQSSPDGARIAFLMKDDAGIVQIWTVSPRGGAPRQLTSNPHAIASAFSWSPDGRWIAHAMDGSVCRTDARTGRTERLTFRSSDASAPRPEACVFSPDGRRITFIRQVVNQAGSCNQIFVVEP